MTLKIPLGPIEILFRGERAAHDAFAFDNRYIAKFGDMPARELDLVRQDEVEDARLMIGILETVNDGAPLERDLTTIRQHGRLCDHPFDGHGEVEFDHVTRFPGAAQNEVAFPCAGFRLGPVHGDFRSLAPPGNPEAQFHGVAPPHL